ncbi:MAG TPA: type II toxin-antitoxin system VapC family toxin [Solirubrobacterales bacterium]|nr:type II toxin-antitoxin system VapC family toxin [Solirubrobacterales bacterium]
MTTATLVDSNVLIDVFGGDGPWTSRSATALEAAANAGPLVINQVIYAEIAVRYEDTDELDGDLPRDVFQRESVPWSAAFLAGKAFEIYRGRGGVRRSPLPDFFIGAHAAVTGLRLLTRDASRYRSYFPTVELIAPE